MEFFPDILKTPDGTRVTRDMWEDRRREMIGILAREEYGFLPPVTGPGRGRTVSVIRECCSGHAVLEKMTVDADTPKGTFSFPVNFFRPLGKEKAPLFLLINFRPDAYDMYYPAEEIIDNGFALAVIYYQDITTDDADMSNGLAGMFDRPGDGTGYGKISLWAWAISRALDCLITDPVVDREHIAVIGHSRLGKTALWAGANDTRFRYVISNDSGCGGAAYERIKHGTSETVKSITTVFPYWFCENFRAYASAPDKRPFDQHFLLAASAPRYVLVHSAEDDEWADPAGEQNSCIAASPAWELNGLPGFTGPEGIAETNRAYTDGCIGYRKRDGIHFLGRSDWQSAMDFIRKHY